jgi:Cu/Zn superoxide dismutase
MTKSHTGEIKKRKGVAGLLVVAALTLGAAGAASAANQASSHGTFNETQAGADLGYDIHGSAKMTISSSGTVVKVNVAGLDPAKEYGSHLHNGTCASGGGGHYQDIEGGATVPPNELWLTTSGSILESNRGGVAHTTGSATWEARTSSTSLTNALSVVVHEPGGVRIACADLD